MKKLNMLLHVFFKGPSGRISICLFFSLNLIRGSAQETSVFKGKNYLVYPHYLQTYSSHVEFNPQTLTIQGIDLPPVIGMMKDGEYIIYSERYELVPRGKKKLNLFDTVYKVYATFTVKDNKKEGMAHIYRVKEQTLLASVPYKNDVIDGHIILEHIGFYYQKSFYYYKSLGKGKNISVDKRYFVLEYSEGMLQGKMRLYGISRKDTLLLEEQTVKDGVRNGPGTTISYYRKGKRILKHEEMSGAYANGKKQGIWHSTDYYWHAKETQIFNDGKLTYSRNEAGNGKYVYSTSYGRHSVIKYVPDYKEWKKVPFTEYYRNDEEVSYDYVRIHEIDNKRTMYFVIDHYASENYYSDYAYKQTKDTFINGRLFRTYKEKYQKYRSEEFYIIDTCGWTAHHDITIKSMLPLFCKILLWTKTYDKKDKLKTFLKEEAYDRYLFKDSLVPQLTGIKKTKTAVEEMFYHKALDYRFSNMTIAKGKTAGCRMYYRVNGGYKTGSIIQYIKIPVAGTDTITLVDTLMSKGKYLYTHDSYFYDAYSSLLEPQYAYSDYENEDADTPSIEKRFNQYVYDFFNLFPALHKTVFYGKKHFSGMLQVHVDYRKKPSYVLGTVIEVKSLFDFLDKKLEMHVWVELGKERYKVGNNAFILPFKQLEYEIDEGLFSGSATFEDIYGQVSVSTYYYRNALHSKVMMNAYLQARGDYDSDLDYNKRYGVARELVKEDIYPVQSSSIQYSYGQKDGYWTITDVTGHINKQLTFHRDRQNGMQLLFFSGEGSMYPYYIYHAVNDTVNGKVWAMNENGYPEYEGQFNMGVPDGLFRHYFSTRDTGRFFVQQMQFDNGFLTGRYLKYRDSNDLAMSIEFRKNDSLKFSVFAPLWQEFEMYPDPSDPESENLHLMVESIDMEMAYVSSLVNRRYSSGYGKGGEIFDGYAMLAGLFSESYISKGLYTYYYKSGTEFMKGRKAHYRPEGEWRFYREGRDRIYKIIHFKDSVLHYPGGDTMRTFGRVSAFYDDGRLMFSGYATDRSSAYSCESGADMPVEEDYYLEFYDTAGKPLLLNGSGMIRELQANGYVLKEGKVENYKKEGLWIYYTKFGLPEKIGAFRNGKKNGRWLSGDLGGLNLDEHICYMSDEEFRAWINIFGGDLNLEESYYLDGKRISVNQVNTIKH